MEKIKGLIDAPFTPMLANGDVNFEPIPAYAAMLAKNGLKGVFINGSSGEGYMLTTDERMRLAEAWMAAVPKDFKVIVHVGSCCLRESVRLAEHAQSIGAWGIGSMAPPFPKIGRIEELVEYCEAIAGAAPKLPFYYYHIPAFNGAFLPMVDLLKAVDGRIPNFAGIKYTFESLYEYNQCRLYKDGKYDMLHGQDETILPEYYQRLDRRRTIAYDILSTIPGVKMKKSESGILSWLDVSQLGTGQEVADYIKENANVLVNDGAAYGQMGQGHIRIVTACFAKDEDCIIRLERIKKALTQLAKEKEIV